MERIQLRDSVKALKAELELEETTHTQTVGSTMQGRHGFTYMDLVHQTYLNAQRFSESWI